MSGRIVVLQHQPDVTVDALGERLTAAGAALDVVDVTSAGAALPGEVVGLDAYDALVVLGGEMNVWQEAEHPWLIGEKAVIRAWLAGPTRPLLGICLGHQLLADALGGDVGACAVPEAGVRAVRRTDAGAGDPVVGALGSTFAALQWHGAEVRRVPDGATVLATNDRSAVQAMRVGTAAWGVQFHPEIGRATALDWGRSDVFRALLERDGGPGAGDRYPGAVRASAAALEATTAALAAALMGQVERTRKARRSSGPKPYAVGRPW